MPYKKPYQASTMQGAMQKGMGSHMGAQGSSTSIPVSHYQSKPTGKTLHRANMSNPKGAKKFNHG